jgi:EAL domain-containing protein (putative c-di-GMP-specific phosphodiesterase class I)
VEALVRWQRASGDLIPPAGFIPLAEETGLIVPMGRWILRTACAQAAEWRARGVPVAMSVNLSAKQMENDQLISDVRAVLSDTGLPADLLWLEVTETIFTGDVGAATARRTPCGTWVFA